MTKCNAHGKSLALHGALTAMMLQSCAAISEAHIIPIRFAAGGRTEVGSDDTNEIIVPQITFEDVASILRPCDNKYCSNPGMMPYEIDTVYVNTENISNKARGDVANNKSTVQYRNRCQRMRP